MFKCCSSWLDAIDLSGQVLITNPEDSSLTSEEFIEFDETFPMVVTSPLIMFSSVSDSDKDAILVTKHSESEVSEESLLNECLGSLNSSQCKAGWTSRVFFSKPTLSFVTKTSSLPSLELEEEDASCRILLVRETCGASLFKDTGCLHVANFSTSPKGYNLR